MGQAMPGQFLKHFLNDLEYTFAARSAHSIFLNVTLPSATAKCGKTIIPTSAVVKNAVVILMAYPIALLCALNSGSAILSDEIEVCYNGPALHRCENEANIQWNGRAADERAASQLQNPRL